MCMKAKYEPGGEFNPDWCVNLIFVITDLVVDTTISRHPNVPEPTQEAPPPEAPQPPEEPPLAARPAWRITRPRGSRRTRTSQTAPPPPPPPPEQRPVQSWATWQRTCPSFRFHYSIETVCLRCDIVLQLMLCTFRHRLRLKLLCWFRSNPALACLVPAHPAIPVDYHDIHDIHEL